MTESAWHDLIKSPRHGRIQEKPRKIGLTMVIDTGIGLQEMDDILNLSGKFIDIVKLGFGSSFLYPESILRKKIQKYKQYNIQVCPGGTFLEIAVLQGVWKKWLERCNELGFTSIEVSDGTIELPRSLRNQLIKTALSMNFQVYSEVGKKEDGTHLPIEEQIRCVEDDLAAGASKVIIEGRESGTNVGVFDADGSLRASDIEQLNKHFPSLQTFMWEAPLKSQQVKFIHQFGGNVNLGNIAMPAVLPLECLRQGLRSDTMPQQASFQRKLNSNFDTILI